MKSQPQAGQITQIERQILRVICQGIPDSTITGEAYRRLENYCWSTAENETIFKAVSPIRDRSADLIREQLPARLTRMGFPDAVWEDLFEPHGLKRAEAERLIDQHF